MPGRGAPLGNKNSCKENRLANDALRRAIAQDGGVRLRQAMENLLNAAASKDPYDLASIKELFDRLDGKALQAIVGAEGGDFVIRIERSDAGL